MLSPQENLERLLERIERRPFQLGHRTLRWKKRSARLIISRTHALQFAHSYLPQARPPPHVSTYQRQQQQQQQQQQRSISNSSNNSSSSNTTNSSSSRGRMLVNVCAVCWVLLQSATCGLLTTVRLTAPLPASWSPWADISQGQEVFPIPAINEVDPEPPPTDFCISSRAATAAAAVAAAPFAVENEACDLLRRNVLLGRLPSSSMLCLCTGCVPRNVDISSWERIELPSYCDALRDPVTGRIYCAGANPAFCLLPSVAHRACLLVGMLDAARGRLRRGELLPIAAAEADAAAAGGAAAKAGIDAAAAETDAAAAAAERDSSMILPEDLQFRVIVAKTRHAGWELRTAERIPKGAFVMQYVGEVIPRAVMDGRSRQEARKGYHNYCMEVVGEESDLEYDWAAPCIDSLFIGNVSRFLNHSCDPNVRVATIWRGPCLPLVGVFALKDIPAGAALTYAYGPGYEEMLCLCGAANCEGFIGGGAGDAGDKGLPICSVSLALRAGALKAKSLQPKAAEAPSA
ncbi:hypothetical protein Emed_005749 [Eimeria media]